MRRNVRATTYRRDAKDRGRLGLAIQRERARWAGNAKVPGRAAILNDEQRARLAAAVEAGSIRGAYAVMCWRLANLEPWMWDARLSGISCVGWAVEHV